MVGRLAPVLGRLAVKLILPVLNHGEGRWRYGSGGAGQGSQSRPETSESVIRALDCVVLWDTSSRSQLFATAPEVGVMYAASGGFGQDR